MGTFPESPGRMATFDLEGSDTEGSPTSLGEGRFDFPCTPVNDDLAKQFLTMDPEEEDKMMKTAASEIAKSLDLPVRKATTLRLDLPIRCLVHTQTLGNVTFDHSRNLMRLPYLLD